MSKRGKNPKPHVKTPPHCVLSMFFQAQYLRPKYKNDTCKIKKQEKNEKIKFFSEGGFLDFDAGCFA
jgi:hypothetical protein